MDTIPELEFIKQIMRIDVLNNILKNTMLNSKDLYNILMNDNIIPHDVLNTNTNTNTNTNKKSTIHTINTDDKRKGFIYETLSIILLISKCLSINYTQILTGQLQSLKICKNINELLQVNIVQGSNPSDITIKQCNITIPISIKYRNKFLPNMSSVSEIDGEINKIKHLNILNYMIGLIVKDKTIVEKHTYKNEGGNQKILHDKVIKDNLLLDETDIVNGLELFCNKFTNYKYKLDDFIDMINRDYLLSGRIRLILKLQQQLTFLKFIRALSNKQYLHLVAHKPRSGKSITLLNICKYLLDNGIHKILIMTSVPATINSFIDDLDKYIDFKDIKYTGQDHFKNIKLDFTGIVFCSVQYLKTNVEEKTHYLQNFNFDVMIIDECHMGSSTKKTEKHIINASGGDNRDNRDNRNNTEDYDTINTINTINNIRNNIKINIFASGTSDKTKTFYKIKKANIYCWDIEDEGYMKHLTQTPIPILTSIPTVKLIKDTNKDTNKDTYRNEILDIMINRHGSEFIECYNDNTLNKDYSKTPIQVLIKHLIPETIITDIKAYNIKHNTGYGYSCSSIFALQNIHNNTNNTNNNNTSNTSNTSNTRNDKYENIFELEKSADGIELLKSFFECIISNNKMDKTTIMKKIEDTQTTYKSRISHKGDPKLFLIYLPTHTGNNNIAQLQITFKTFINKHKLWQHYNIEYSNSNDDSSDYKEEYNTYIKTILNKSLNENKIGCILLLGNKGGVGITYHNCDATISLDDGHNLDNQRQRYSRALTEVNSDDGQPPKTIGINVDMNIQRTYLYLNDIIHKHRLNTKTTKSNGTILKYLYEQNIFIFNPTEIKNGKVKAFEITEYYNKEADNILQNIDYNNLLNDINVIDDDIILDKDEDSLELIWNKSTQELETKKHNTDLDGEQQDVPKGDKEIKTYEIDNKTGSNSTNNSNSNSNSNDDSNNEIDSNDEDILIPLQKVEENKIEKQKRFLKEVCTRVLFQLLALLSRTYHELEFTEMLFHNNTKEIINSILEDKKIILNKNAYNSIIRIMDTNNEIINNIREIYRTAPANKIHQLIAKHFIPSIEEKKNNAEIPTPLELVNEMLNKMPEAFWKTLQRVFEPCCGKGNFVMKIFEKFYNGLMDLYPDAIERCKVIITECLYFADLTPMNIFITTEILKCEIQSRTGINIDDINYTFNSYVGDTLKIDINQIFNINNFDAICGNPPYNDNSGNKGKGHMLWDKFVIISLNIFLKENGYLVYVHPAVWRQYEHPCLNILKDKQIIYLEIHNVDDGQKTFRCATRYDWYVLQNTKNIHNTIIKGEDGLIYEVDLKEWTFIPNMMFDEIKNLISNNNEKLDINYYRSNYGADKKWVNKIKHDEFKYPVVYSINKENKLSLCYSNKKENGHFGLSKFIFSNGLGFYCDNEGEYGLTQWAYCIYDTPAILPLIEKTFRSTKFNKIKEAIHLDSSSYNIKVMKLFKKDFYNAFININIEPLTIIINNNSDTINTINNIDNIDTIDTNNTHPIIQNGRCKYYLIDNKLYKVKKDKTQGILFGSYIDNQIIELKPKKHSKHLV